MKEKWEEIYTKDQLLKIQKIEKDELKEIIRICNILKLDFIVYGGTLLGTIKYGDIIPWDDDVDIAMPRKDYMIFLKEAPKLLESNFILQTPYNEIKSPYPYTKLRKKGTKMIEKYYNRLKIQQGVYVDIYPIDNVPDNEIDRKKQFYKIKKWIRLYYYRQCLRFDLNPKKILKTFIYTILYFSLKFIPQKYFISKIDNYMSKYNEEDTERKACFFSPNFQNIFIKFYPLENKKFGDILVKVPCSYDDHLRKRYGDYKKNLPPEKRIGHSPYEIEV